MNVKLTEEIIKHVLFSWKIIPSDHVSPSTESLLSNKYLLDNKLSKMPIFGCHMTYDQSDIKVLATNCSEDEIFEFAFLISIKDSPSYGCYLIVDPSNETESEPLIGVLVEKQWIPCSTYLQSTFLSGMEQLKDLGNNWKKAVDYDHEIDKLLEFISFHHSFYGVNSEG